MPCATHEWSSTPRPGNLPDGAAFGPVGSNRLARPQRNHTQLHDAPGTPGALAPLANHGTFQEQSMRNMIRAALVIGTLATPMLAAADAPKAKAPATEKKEAPAADKKTTEPATDKKTAEPTTDKKDVKAPTTDKKPATKKPKKTATAVKKDAPSK